MPTDYEKQRDAYDRLVATNPEVERKGDTVPYTSVNGNMFSYLSKAGTLSLRLPSPDREAFLTKYKTKLSEQYGIVQKEYVEVPAALLGDTKSLKRYFDLSYDYTRGLKAKPTTRAKSAAKGAAKKSSSAKKRR